MKTFLLLALLMFYHSKAQVKIAFISDIHFQDLYGIPGDVNFRGTENPKTKKRTFLRSMDSQLRSTRIFNEIYFALSTAFDSIQKQGIRLVVLPGDCTDNGQTYNLRGLKNILNRYSKKYGMRFLATTGNHDPVRPFSQAAATEDFLDSDGETYTISSKKQSLKNQKTIFSKDFEQGGYMEVLNEFEKFGFKPDKNDLFWQTPFSKGNYVDYTFLQGTNDAKIANREYEVQPGFKIPDFSYVAEPVKGIWLLAIDGNTYIPVNSEGNPENPQSYSGAEIGYNNVLTNKSHLFPWIKKIAAEAERLHQNTHCFHPLPSFGL